MLWMHVPAGTNLIGMWLQDEPYTPYGFTEPLPSFFIVDSYSRVADYNLREPLSNMVHPVVVRYCPYMEYVGDHIFLGM